MKPLLKVICFITYYSSPGNLSINQTSPFFKPQRRSSAQGSRNNQGFSELQEYIVVYKLIEYLNYDIRFVCHANQDQSRIEAPGALYHIMSLGRLSNQYI